MVFKAVGGVDKNVYEVYKSDQTSSEDKVEALDVTNKYRDHYKNRIVLAWQAFDASEVLSNKYYHPSSNRDCLSAKAILNNLLKKGPPNFHFLDECPIYTWSFNGIVIVRFVTVREEDVTGVKTSRVTAYLKMENYCRKCLDLRCLTEIKIYVSLLGSS